MGFVLRKLKASAKRPKPKPIEIHRIKVRKAGDYGFIFNRREKFVRPHIFSTNPRECLQELKALFKNIPEFKKAGIAGFAGDTVNPVIAKQFKRLAIENGLSVTEIKTPSKDIKAVRNFYATGVRKHGFPEKHLANQPIRLIARF